ncbi:hypothetical protein [Winogradskyella flava]|uniref:hypothetical protein n=1 Tax=Winogradskyella flava TaxID=1884876 RepID=UPI002490A9FD|nr:hypothetical protein [Winogradskyella flava]
MKKCLIILVAILVLFSCEKKRDEHTADIGWTLVYKHDKQGNRIFGNKTELIEAIQNGLSVRVGYGTEINTERSIEHIAEAQFLTILKITDQHEVFAQINPIMRQDPFRQSDTIAIKMIPEYQWRTTISTNGISSNVMINIFKDSLEGSNQISRQLINL